MDRLELDAYLCREISSADARVSLLAKNIDTGETLHAHGASAIVPSASVIKVPVMLAALQNVMHGKMSLDSQIPVPRNEILEDTEVFDRACAESAYPLDELIYWMIADSDNTAANVLIGLAGFDAINAYIRSLGLHSTVLLRKMLDFAARRSGVDNLTSAADMGALFTALCRDSILTPRLCRFAMDTLRRQRDTEKLPRYISDDVALAHKTGGLAPVAGHDRVCHDAGVFLLRNIRLYLGIFITGAPDDARYAHRLIGSLAKAVYDNYKE